MVLCVRCPGPPGSCSPVCTLCVWCCVYGVLGLLAPVHRCARCLCGVACTVSWDSWLLFIVVHALCVVLRVRCPGPPGSCSPVCTLCVWCCVYAVLGLLAPVHRCARSVRGVVCTLSWASWLLFTDVHALCVVLRVRCPWPPGSCSPVCTLCVWCCVYGVLGLLAPVRRCARSVCGVASTVSLASKLRFAGVHPLGAVLCVRCPGPLGSCPLVRVLVVLCRLCRVLGFLAPVLRRVRSVCRVVCVVSWDSWFVFSGVAVCCGVRDVRCAVLRVRCPGPPGPCSLVRTPGLWCCVGGVLGRLAPVACSVCCVFCAVSWARWLLFTGVRARCVAWCVRCGCGRVLACTIPLQRRCGLFVFVYTWLDTVGNAAANSPLASWPPRRPASYGVLLVLPVLDSLVLATPKSKRVLMHAWRCMLFTRWFVDSLHFATPESRRVCSMHS